MAKPTIRLNVDQALDVHGDILAEIAFHIAFVFNRRTNAVNLVFAEILDLLERVYISRRQETQRTRVADPENIRKRDPCLLVAGQIDASNTCHADSFSCRDQTCETGGCGSPDLPV